MAKFEGFSPDAFKFLKRLKKHNDRDWFVPRKDEFDELLKKPLLAFIHDLAQEMGHDGRDLKIAPKAMLRIYRDTRFSKDKVPYKTFVGASFDMVGYPKSVSSPGMYVQLEPENTFAGGGLYMPESRALRRIRYAMDQKPDSYLDLIEDRAFKKFFGEIHGEKLKKAPQGYLPDHPMIEHLKRKQFFVLKDFADKEAESPNFVKKVADVYRRALPFARWLRDHSV